MLATLLASLSDNFINREEPHLGEADLSEETPTIEAFSKSKLRLALFGFNNSQYKINIGIKVFESVPSRIAAAFG